MPRTPRNPGSGKPPYNGPARGAGLWGDAKGAGTGGGARGKEVIPFEPFEAGGSGNPSGKPSERKAVRFEKANAFLENVLGKEDLDPRTGIQAAVALGTLNKPADGPSTVVNVAQTIDRPPPETREQWLERRRREIAGGLMGTPAGSAD